MSDDCKAGKLTQDDYKKIISKAESLISSGQNPKCDEGSSSWNLCALAQWYGGCCGLSRLLGSGNEWDDMLRSWTPQIGRDRDFHEIMLGTLAAVRDFAREHLSK